jgi:hypothetical protein
LDYWQKLGLLSPEQVRQICRKYLVCTLPTPEPIAAPTDPEPDFITDFISTEPRRRPVTPGRRQASFDLPILQSDSTAQPEQPTPFLAQKLQALMAEISVIWLLFLGVFMVVVSSGVLAASQWNNFSPAGQYAVLWSYTLAFWGVSLWTNRNPSLRLTTQMLQATTLLIIPINFWMMDAVQIWQQGLGWAIALIAAISLTTILSRLLRPLLPPFMNFSLLVNGIALSWLHWGWSFALLPLLATYIGTMGTAATLAYQDRNRPVMLSPVDPASNEVAASTTTEAVASEPSPHAEPLSLGLITIAFSALLLIVRALWVAQVPFSQLSLAVGICGWLLCWLSRYRPAYSLWSIVGLGLMIAAWLVAVTVEPPWQAIAISGLGLWILGDRLYRLHRPEDLAVFALVGLQAYCLIWGLFPSDLRQLFLDWCDRVAHSDGLPLALLGLGLLPYLWLMLWLTHQLQRNEQPHLAKFAEFFALGLGMLLTAASLLNPLTRSLNLSLSTLTLFFVIYRRQSIHRFFVYLTHATGLGAIAAWIYWFLPDLSRNRWAALLLIGMMLEWVASLDWLGIARTSEPVSQQPRIKLWRRSAWRFGLILSGLSYWLLMDSSYWVLVEEISRAPVNRAWIWLLTPLSLTILGYQRRLPERKTAIWLSIVALIVIQPLTIFFPLSRLIGLGLATGLMMFNTKRVKDLSAALLTVGFGLCFGADAIWQTWGDRLTLGWIWLLLAIATLLLWALRSALRHRRTVVAKLYRQSTHAWAIAITGFNLLCLSVSVFITYIAFQPVELSELFACGITVIAIAYRMWKQPTNWGFYGIAWSIELLLANGLALQREAFTGLSIPLAITNLALGLTTQWAGNWWVHRSQTAYRSSWHLIPLFYAMLGVMAGHANFTASTGLYTLAFAVVGIGIARRQPTFQPLTYCALATVSVAAYELLIYQLLQATGGEPGDGMVLLAGLGSLLVWGDRLSARWWRSYLHLPPEAVHRFATLHWVLSSGLLLLALTSPRSITGGYLWVTIATILAIYALWEGRRQAPWIYTGIATGLLALSYFFYLVVPNTADLLTWAGAIACPLAYGMYAAPWHRWGWSNRPWQQSAVVLPGIMLLLTAWSATIPVVLIIAAFYAWLAQATAQIRFSYLSLLLTDWALFRWLWQLRVPQPLWYACVLGFSLLYIAQIDPDLRSPSERDKRHLLRLLAVGLICLTAIYQSETSLAIALLTVGLGLALLLLGLMLQIRAFLFVGTFTFLGEILRQLWLLFEIYPLLIWAVLFVLGLLLLWIAATFEARRAQVSALVRYWLVELEQWE